jgi:hypothetical protein
MRLAKTDNSIPAYVPAKPKEPARAQPAVDVEAVHEYFRQYPSGIRIGGPIGNLGALSLGAPLRLAPKIEFQPLLSNESISNLGAPAIGLNPAAELVSTFTEAAEARSPSKALWGAIDFAEAIPELPRHADVAVHALGVLKLAPRTVKALRKHGNTAEKSAALVQMAGALASLITDCPGLESGKQAAEIFAVVIKVGETICTVPYQPIPAAVRGKL